MKNRVFILVLLLATWSPGAVAQLSICNNNEEFGGTTGVVNPAGHWERWKYFRGALITIEPQTPQSLPPRKNENEKPEVKKEPTPQSVPPVSGAKPDPLNMTKEEFEKYKLDTGGDPYEPAYVEPDPDAPPPFKIMHACLQRGDFECARAYAEKYINSNIRQEELYYWEKKITEMILREKGYLPKSTESEDPDYENFPPQSKRGNNTRGNASAVESMAKEGEGVGNITLQGGPGQLPETVERLLREGERKEDQYLRKNRDSIPPSQDEGEVLRMLSIPEPVQRKLASDRYHGLLSKDEQGAVRVYFFFRQEDLNAYAMFPVLERIYQAHNNDKGFMLLAFSLSHMTDMELKAMQGKVKVRFPLRSSPLVASELGITSSPTTLVVAPGNGTYAREEGVRGFGFIDELVRIVDGSGSSKIR